MARCGRGEPGSDRYNPCAERVHERYRNHYRSLSVICFDDGGARNRFRSDTVRGPRTQ